MKRNHSCLQINNWTQLSAEYLQKIGVYTSKECTIYKEKDNVMNTNHFLVCKGLDQEF